VWPEPVSGVVSTSGADVVYRPGEIVVGDSRGYPLVEEVAVTMRRHLREVVDVCSQGVQLRALRRDDL
jgi:hypothetical protein